MKRSKKVRWLFLFTVVFFTYLGSASGQTIQVGLGNEFRKDPTLSILTKFTYDLEFLDPNFTTSLDIAVFPEFSGNLDVHYAFQKNGLDIYGLSGVNLSHRSGLNMGVGLNLAISEELSGFAELKYILRYQPEPTLKFGLFYQL
jgi:hypothetical protein